MSTITAAITAVGGYVPEYVLTNDILATMVETNDDWITSRTGIKERRILERRRPRNLILWPSKQPKIYFLKIKPRPTRHRLGDRGNRHTRHASSLNRSLCSH